MDRQEQIREAHARGVKAMQTREGVGKGTAVTKAQWTSGLACEIQDGPWKLQADMSEKTGGDNSAPNPGVYGRSALASCLIAGYLMAAARARVPFDSLEVEIQADYDARGEYGFAGYSPAYSQIRCVVGVSSPASKAEVMQVLDEADRISPYLTIFKGAQECMREVHFAARKA